MTDSPNRNTVDVAIVGAGLAGTALAAALRGQGLSIALIEARPLTLPVLPQDYTVTSFDARVSALNLQSSAFLQRLGAWQDVLDYRACAYSHMSVWDAEGTGAIDFDASEVDRPCLGHIVENRAVVAALLKTVLDASDVRLLAPARLAGIERDAEAMTVQLDDGTTLRSKLLVAADGALSAVRQSLDFATREWDYGHSAIVTTVATELPHLDTARQRFLPSGPLAYLPLPDDGDGHFCSIVWSLQEARASEIMALDDAAFCTALGEALEWRLGAVQAASPRVAFPLRQRHATDYIQPRVALVADAAHTIHPLAGQGINLGFKDVEALAEEVIAARQRGMDIGDMTVLRRYQRRRKGDNLLMMGAMDGFKRLFEEDALPLRWLRNIGMSGVSRAGPLKTEIMRRAMGLA